MLSQAAVKGCTSTDIDITASFAMSTEQTEQIYDRERTVLPDTVHARLRRTTDEQKTALAMLQSVQYCALQRDVVSRHMHSSCAWQTHLQQARAA